jgi:hypothetical protein
LAPEFRKVVDGHRCAFLDAGEYVTGSDADGVHLDRGGHAALGGALAAWWRRSVLAGKHRPEFSDKKVDEQIGGLLIRGSQVRILPGAWNYLALARKTGTVVDGDGVDASLLASATYSSGRLSDWRPSESYT